MTPTKKCRSCGTAVPLDTLHCPNCPASFETEEDNIFSNRRRTTRVSPAVLWTLAIAVVCLGMWRLITFVLVYADNEAASNPIDQMTQSLSGSTTTASEQAMSVVAPTPAPAGAHPAPSAGSAQPSGDQDDAASSDDAQAIMISHDDEAPAPRAKAKPARHRPAKPKGPQEWRLRGTVYDVVTLRPAAGVQVTLKDSETSRSIDTVTDAAGRYRFNVPPLPGRGYSVVFTSPKYAPSYVDPDDESIRERSPEERKQLASQLARELDPPYPVQGLAGEPVTTDFYLAPRD